MLETIGRTNSCIVDEHCREVQFRGKWNTSRHELFAPRFLLCCSEFLIEWSRIGQKACE